MNPAQRKHPPKKRDFLLLEPEPPERDYTGWVFPERCEKMMSDQVTVALPADPAPTKPGLKHRRGQYNTEYFVPERDPTQWAVSERVENQQPIRSQPVHRQP